jgi:hypothetical protein
MDNLALDAKMALQAGMSYGRWKATKPVTKEKEKLMDVSGMIKRECKNCGTVFYTRRHNKTYCTEVCRLDRDRKAQNEKYRRLHGKD